jgi:FAD/FMN-containing dehydrogenase
MEAYLGASEARLKALLGEELRWAIFGHLGDGNLHIGVALGSDDPALKAAVEDIVYGELAGTGGSISAEHGIGLEKRAYLHCSRSPEELALMKTLKCTLDPRNILNPGKIFSL